MNGACTYVFPVFLFCLFFRNIEPTMYRARKGVRFKFGYSHLGLTHISIRKDQSPIQSAGWTGQPRGLCTRNLRCDWPHSVCLSLLFEFVGNTLTTHKSRAFLRKPFGNSRDSYESLSLDLWEQHLSSIPVVVVGRPKGDRSESPFGNSFEKKIRKRRNFKKERKHTQVGVNIDLITPDSACVGALPAL